MINSEYLEKLRSQPLLKGLNDSELAQFADELAVENYSPGSFILREGEKGKDIYFVVEGSVSFVKADEQGHHLLEVHKGSKGAVFGEMAFIDGNPRSVSVKAIDPTTVLKFTPKEGRSDSATKDHLEALVYRNGVKLSLDNLRNTNRNYAQSLRAQIDFGLVFIATIVILGFGEFMNLMARDYGVNSHTMAYSYTYLFLLFLPVFFVTYKMKYPPEVWGVTWKNFTRSAWQGILISLGVISTIIAGYLFYDFEFTEAKPLSQAIYPKKPLEIFTLLYFVHSYIQEFMARGVLQSSLQRFLNDSRGLKTILITAVLFAVFHLSRGLVAGMVAFMGSLFFGYIYLKQKNLIGVTIVHYIVGIFVIHYLGLI